MACEQRQTDSNGRELGERRVIGERERVLLRRRWTRRN